MATARATATTRAENLRSDVGLQVLMKVHAWGRSAAHRRPQLVAAGATKPWRRRVARGASWNCDIQTQGRRVGQLPEASIFADRLESLEISSLPRAIACRRDASIVNVYVLPSGAVI